MPRRSSAATSCSSRSQPAFLLATKTDWRTPRRSPGLTETLLERNVSVRTPESIAFYYELAGLGSRFLAVAIDLLLQILAGFVVYLLLAWAEPGTTALAKSLGLRDEA